MSVDKDDKQFRGPTQNQLTAMANMFKMVTGQQAQTIIAMVKGVIDSNFSYKRQLLNRDNKKS